MGIADVREALARGAGNGYSFRGVTLSYADGGKQQRLNFSVRYTGKSGKSEEKTIDYIFDGTHDPNKVALELGQRLTDQNELNKLASEGNRNGHGRRQ